MYKYVLYVYKYIYNTYLYALYVFYIISSLNVSCSKRNVSFFFPSIVLGK